MADEGATPRELVLEACRRNNTDLLLEIITTTKPVSSTESKESAVAALLNNTRDSLGNAALHVAAGAGSYETLDLLLDQPGVETDPLTRRDQNTPLHSAVTYVNSLSPTTQSAEGRPVVEILVDAGCDPRIRNKARMKPAELVDPRNTELRDFLRRAEILMVEGEGLVDEGDAGSEGGDGQPSDSD